MKIICYIEDYGAHEQHYITAEDAEVESKIENLGAVIVNHIFDIKDDEKLKAKNERLSFNTLCGAYGFTEDDYNKKIISSDGDVLRFVGFIPKNRRYKARLINERNGHTIKATVQFVKSNIDKD